MKQSWSPSWTIGLKTDAEPKTTDKQNPGPGSYDVRRSEVIVPCGRFGNAARKTQFNTGSNLGPGQYEIPSSFRSKSSTKQGNKSGQGKVSSRERSDKIRMDTPGPGAYNPSKPHRPPQYSMGSKTFSLPSQTPEVGTLGPGEYSPNLKAVQTAQTFSIPRGKRSNLYNVDSSLGPRDYNIPSGSAGPNYKFGKSSRDTINPTAKVPPPWNYNISSFTEENKGKGRSFGMKNAAKTKDSGVPGPGAHTPQTVRTAPAFSMGRGKRQVTKAEDSKAAPQMYFPRNPAMTTRVSSFGTGKRPPIAPTNNTAPGPGAYDVGSSLQTGPKYGITGRKAALKDLMNNPGPGQYTPEIEAVINNGPHHVIGTGQRSGAIKSRPKTNPGPGHYFSAASKAVGPIWTFGKDPRDHYDPDDEPGPGQYDIIYAVPEDLPKRPDRRDIQSQNRSLNK